MSRSFGRSRIKVRPGRLRSCTPHLRSHPRRRHAVEERIARIRAATELAISEVRLEIAHAFVVGQRVYVPGSHFADQLGDGSDIDRTHAARWGAVAWHEAVVTKTHAIGCSVPIPQRTIEVEYVERGSGRTSLGVRYVDEIPAILLAQWRNSYHAEQGLAPFPTAAPR